MIESGLTGAQNVKEINRSAVTGVLVTGLMRVLLFLAVLGVVAGGAKLAEDNPPSSAFQHAAGGAGLRLFGGHRYPVWLLAIGAAARLLSLYLGWNALSELDDLWK